MVRILDILDIKMTKFLLSVGTSGGRCGAGGFQCLHRARGTCKGISEDTGRAGVTLSVSISPNSSKPTAEPTSMDQKHCTNAQEKHLEPRVWQCDVADRGAGAYPTLDAQQRSAVTRTSAKSIRDGRTRLTRCRSPGILCFVQSDELVSVVRNTGLSCQ